MMVTPKHEFKNFTSEKAIHHNKIPIIGTGAVDAACAISILLKVSYVLCAIALIKVSSVGGKATACGYRSVSSSRVELGALSGLTPRKR